MDDKWRELRIIEDQGDIFYLLANPTKPQETGLIDTARSGGLVALKLPRLSLGTEYDIMRSDKIEYSTRPIETTNGLLAVIDFRHPLAQVSVQFPLTDRTLVRPVDYSWKRAILTRDPRIVFLLKPEEVELEAVVRAATQNDLKGLSMRFETLYPNLVYNTLEGDPNDEFTMPRQVIMEDQESGPYLAFDGRSHVEVRDGMMLQRKMLD